MRILVILLLVWSPVVLPAAVQIALHEEVELAKEWATIGDLATIRSEGTSQALTTALAAIRVQRLAGLHPYHIDARRIEQVVASRLAVGDLQVTGSCQVRRRYTQIADEELFARVEASLRGRLPGDDVVIGHERINGQIGFPTREREPTWQIEALSEAVWGQVPFRVRLLDGEEELGRVLVVVRVQVVRQLPVATRQIERGATIQLTDLRLIERELDRHSGTEPPSIEELAGRVAARRFVAGDPVTRNGTRPPLAVHAGANVLLVYENERFQIQVTGEALNDGTVGEIIRVRQPNGELVRAEVVGDGRATVNF